MTNHPLNWAGLPDGFSLPHTESTAVAFITANVKETFEELRALQEGPKYLEAGMNDHGAPQLLLGVCTAVLNIWHDHRAVILSAVALIVLSLWTRSYLRPLLLRKRRVILTAAAPEGEGLLRVVENVQWPESKGPTSLANGKPVPEKEQHDAGDEEKVTVRTRAAPKRVTGSKTASKSRTEMKVMTVQPLVFYFSLTDTTKPYATDFLRNTLSSLKQETSSILDPKIYDLAVLDYEDFFEHAPREMDTNIRYFYLLLIPSYNIDTALDNFLALLKETHNDFRIDTAPLSDVLGYSVFGFGDQQGWPTEADGFCSQAIEVDRWMAKLTAKKRAYPLGLGDVRSNNKRRFQEWSDGISKTLVNIIANGDLGEGVSGSGDAEESDEEEQDVKEYDEADSLTVTTIGSSRRKQQKHPARVDDLEDLGLKAQPDQDQNSLQGGKTSPIPVDFTSYPPSQTSAPGPKPMVPATSPTHAALTKQGYTIIGTHSGVKICRWTKSALRGRGSCYKYSFYGIKSHLCMETTPSLSCSNKCVFCWRHGTNPVGTSWRWQVDPPEMIFNGAKEGHYKKIKMMRGVPGLRAERFQEAMHIRHCALSLVGEPIFYPHINEFLEMLHKEHISSFLVCNAQHPDHLQALQTVTQLYVSIDASNAESLRKIDRPLYRDYWQRFLRCLDILHEKRFRMRTVFRLTLVKGFNIEEEVKGYADLVARGLPCFVEVKGVTYCGTSSSANAGLTMQNVPFYHEVVNFVEALNVALEERGLEYGIGAEHAHSCCVLIASKRFLVKGKWHTRIDYDKFFECLESGKEFSPEDYMDSQPTPDWAAWGNGGFDPADVRVDRKGRPKQQLVEATKDR